MSECQLVFNAIPIGVTVHSPDHEILEANAEACRLLGKSREELVGQKCYQVFHGKDSPVDTCPLEISRQSLHRESAEIFEPKLSAWLSITTTPVLDGQGKLERIVHAFYDVTERKQLEHQLGERLKELRAFYSLAEMTEREGLTQEGLYQELANVLPASWQYPEITSARITIGDREFRSPNFAESVWKQSAPVKVGGAAAGRIDVYYLEQKPEQGEGPFMKEERMLIEAIAERLGRITERRRLEAELREKMNEYKLISEAAVGRELKMMELEKEIARLKGDHRP